MNSFIRRILSSSTGLALLLCAAAGASAQAIYKQVDDTGRVTFTDQPPARPAARPRRAGTVDINEAARRLKQARTERVLGSEPRSGEVTSGAGTRTMNYRYWRRQEKLRLLVEQAQRRSQETIRMQAALG